MMSKPSFDATTTVSSEFGIFGIPLDFADCELILLPVPWEATTSYGPGASDGPAIIRNASEQIDLFDLDYGKVFERGIHMLPIDEKILALNQSAKSWPKRPSNSSPIKVKTRFEFKNCVTKSTKLAQL